MKTYFGGAIRYNYSNIDLYTKIINHIKKYSEVFYDPILLKMPDARLKEEPGPDKHREEEHKKIRNADNFIAELSMPSTGLGYYIREAEDLGKIILCLYDDSAGYKPSYPIIGNKNPI